MFDPALFPVVVGGTIVATAIAIVVRQQRKRRLKRKRKRGAGFWKPGVRSPSLEPET